MTHVPAHVMKIEVFQASIPGIMKQYENCHDFRIRHHAIAMILAFFCHLATCQAFCSTVLSKTLLKSSHIEKISIILSSGNIAVVFIVFF